MPAHRSIITPAGVNDGPALEMIASVLPYWEVYADKAYDYLKRVLDRGKNRHRDRQHGALLPRAYGPRLRSAGSRNVRAECLTAKRLIRI
jgi:hypothetical protein